MHESYRLPRSTFFIGLIGLPALAVAVAGFSGWLEVGEAPLASRFIPGGIGLLFFLLGAYLMAAAKLERLVIDGQCVIRKGTFRTVEIHLRDVTQARWTTATGGGLKLIAANTRMSICFREFAIPSPPIAARYLRAQMPDSVQSGWPWFEHRYLHRFGTFESAGEGKVLFDRRRMDRWLLPSAGVFLATGVAVSWFLSDPRQVVPFLLAGALTASLRYLVPRQGYYVQSMNSACREQPEMRWLMWWLLLLLPAKVFCKSLPVVVGALIAIASVLLICAVGIKSAVRERRQRQAVEANWRPQ